MLHLTLTWPDLTAPTIASMRCVTPACLLEACHTLFAGPRSSACCQRCLLTEAVREGQDEVLQTVRMLDQMPLFTRGSQPRLKLLAVPLYAALSSADQMQAFAPTPRNSRKVGGPLLPRFVAPCHSNERVGLHKAAP